MELDEAAESLALDAAFWLTARDNPDYPIDQFGDLALKVGARLRAVGIILLVTRGDTDAFALNLARSADIWREYLQRIHAAEAFSDHHYVLGRYEPVLDAIAGGRLDIVADIGRLAPDEFRSGHEYEEDFVYAALLHAASGAESPVSPGMEALAVRFEALVGDDDSRAVIFRSLIAANEADWSAGFERLLEQREASIEDARSSGEMDDPVVEAGRRVFVEGLTHIRLAEIRGIRTADEYLFCPRLARLPMSKAQAGI